MDQPQTHYQVSFTVRQALLLFVGLLLALGIAYFLGLMTGLSGRTPEASTASREIGAAGPPPKPESRAASAAATAPSPAPQASPVAETRAASAEPTAPAELQMFEDAGGPTPTAPPRRILARGVTPPPAPAAAAGGEFWVQVLSVSSEREAKHRTDALKRHKFPAVVVAGSTEKGRVYRVRVGPYRSREDAERGAAALKSREKLDAWIVPAGQ